MASFGALLLTLLDVTPHPRTSARIAPEDYVASILVQPVSADAGSGIQGLVTLGPLCPVARQDQPCPDQPYAADILITDLSGKEVGRTASAGDGRYSQVLPPGTYRIVPQRPEANILPFAGEVTVVIGPGEWLTLDILYDSGIR